MGQPILEHSAQTHTNSPHPLTQSDPDSQTAQRSAHNT